MQWRTRPCDLPPLSTVYCANTIASLLLIGFVAHLGIKWHVDWRLLVLLGRYSLLLYLVQIVTLVFLQIISRKLALGGGLAGFWIALLLVSFVQVLIAAGTDRLRTWHPFIDRVYGWVFR